MTRKSWSTLAICAALGMALAAVPAHASNTTTLPQGVIVLDESWTSSTTDVRWDDARQARPLIAGIDRYEPGGGLQGTITAQPHVVYKLLVSQLQYGVTDHLTLAVAMPVVAESHIQPHLGWVPGVYQPQMGRQYTENDFWQWAKSMGQPKPGNFDGNRWTPADMVLATRWRLPERWLKDAWGLEMAVTGQVALPTGRKPDPEELVAGGTTVWDLHDYGDAELHLAVEKPVKLEGHTRLRVGLDVYHAWLFEQTFQTPHGTRSPLLLTYAPYVGDTFKLDPGDFTGVTGLLQVMPVIGPTWATYISGHKREVAATFPPLLMLWAGISHVAVAQSIWTSQSAWWNWQREKEWLPGDKHTVRLGAEVSLMRLGVPLNLYATYRNQEWIPGRNTRASDVTMLGARLILKFW